MISIKNVLVTFGLLALSASYAMEKPANLLELQKWFARAAIGLEDSTGTTAQQKCDDVLKYGQQLHDQKIASVPDLNRPHRFISVVPKMETAREMLAAKPAKGSRK